MSRQRGLGSVYLRSKVWWIKFYKNGKAKRESSGSEKQADALRLLKQRQGEAVTGAYLGVGCERLLMPGLFQIVLDDYTKRQRRDIYMTTLRVQSLSKVFPKVRASDFGSDHIEQHIDRRRAEGAANATINRELSIIRHAFTLALQMDPPKVKRAPFIRSLPEENARQGFIEKEEYERLYALLDRARLPLVIGYHLGNRKGEILKLEWSMVDLDARQIRLHGTQTKNKKPRTLPIYDGHLLEGLIVAKRDRDANYPKCRWVCSWHGRQIRDFRAEWESATERAELKGLLFHDLRRSAVRNMERAGLSRSVAMAISGHTTESEYRRYDIVSERDLNDAGQKLAAYHKKKPGRVISMKNKAG